MPRKTKANAGAAATAVAEPETAPRKRPDYIDGPPVDADGKIIKSSPSAPDMQMEPEHGKNWGDPYKALVSTASFEMGENRRFRQRVFTFKEKPSEQVLAALKDNGFTYRANEKAWTIQANPDTRRLSDELAREFAGQGAGVSR